MCGIAGVFVSPGESAIQLAYDLLMMLQDRGLDAAGIAASDGTTVLGTFGKGRIPDALNAAALEGLNGHICVGHTRYATSGSSSLRNAQPVHRSSGFFLAENGDLVLTGGTGDDLFAAYDSDTEVLANLLEEQMLANDSTVEDALAAVMPTVKGGFALVVLDQSNLIAVRDPNGIRPLCLGRLPDQGWVLASEDSAFSSIGAEYVRDINPGEMLRISEKGLKSRKIMVPQKRASCIFEDVYFSRPDTHINGTETNTTRMKMGELLADQAPFERGPNDMVMGVPDSGVPAAEGYAHRSGIPYGRGLLRNRYVGRTFIRPNQVSRVTAVGRKLGPLRDNVRGKRLIVVDDSIVRGNTTKVIIDMLRRAGADEIHLRISSPPYKWPCFYGMATGNRGELIAAQYPTEELADELGADSLVYLTMENLLSAVTPGGRCTACLTGEYPVEVPVKLMEFKVERELAEREL